METEKTPFLCDQYNKGGFFFRYPVITSVAFWLHDKTCPDLKEARALEIFEETSDPLAPEMTGAEFAEYLDQADHPEYREYLMYTRGIEKGRIDLANQLLQIVEDNDHPLWESNLQEELIQTIRKLGHVR